MGLRLPTRGAGVCQVGVLYGRMCAILLAFARLPSLALRGRTVGGIVCGCLQLAPYVETVITAAYLHTARRQNHHRTVAHAK